MINFAPRSAGDALAIAAAEWNAVQRAAREAEAGRLGGVGGESPTGGWPHAAVVSCLNNSGAAVVAGDVLRLTGGTAVHPAAQEAAARRRPALIAAAVEAATDAVVVALTPAPAARFFLAVAGGVAVCDVDSTNTSHPAAAPVPGTTRMASAWVGPHRVIGRPGATGVSPCYVRLGAGADRIAWLRVLTYAPTTGGTAVVVRQEPGTGAWADAESVLVWPHQGHLTVGQRYAAYLCGRVASVDVYTAVGEAAAVVGTHHGGLISVGSQTFCGPKKGIDPWRWEVESPAAGYGSFVQITPGSQDANVQIKAAGPSGRYALADGYALADATGYNAALYCDSVDPSGYSASARLNSAIGTGGNDYGLVEARLGSRVAELSVKETALGSVAAVGFPGVHDSYFYQPAPAAPSANTVGLSSSICIADIDRSATDGDERFTPITLGGYFVLVPGEEGAAPVVAGGRYANVFFPYGAGGFKLWFVGGVLWKVTGTLAPEPGTGAPP